MSYPAGEAVVLTLLQAMSEFDRRNTARGDWKPLNSGGSDHYAIIRPGPFANEATALGGASVTAWRTIIEVWQRWVDDAPTVLALEGLVSAVIDHLERYPGLDGLALIAGVTGGGGHGADSDASSSANREARTRFVKGASRVATLPERASAHARYMQS